MHSLPQLEGVLNFRELGGLTAAAGAIRPGRLFRSGHLATATDGDLDVLASLNIGTIIDFRLPSDRRGDGGEDRVPDGAAHVSLPMPDPGGLGKEMRELLISGDEAGMQARFGDGKAHDLATQGAVSQAMEPSRQAVYADFLHTVVAADRPVLFHCSAGKDRAGWAATLLGIALGVSDADLVDHYLLSNVHRPPEQRRDHYASRGIDVDILMPFLGVHEDFIRSTLAAVDAAYPSRAAYLEQALSFDADAVQQLRSRFVE